MKVIVIGTRGIPNIMGGVESHCEHLYPLISQNGSIDVTVIGRSCYVEKKDIQYNGVYLKTIYAPKHKSLEAFVHSLLGILYAFTKKPDIVHIHAIGPSIITPVARFLGMKTVVTHHGPDYERKKWGKLAKTILKLGEWSGVRFANKLIVISEDIKEQLQLKYNFSNAVVIPNGVIKPELSNDDKILQELGLIKGMYIFSLGRFVPEKGFDYLIKAYQQVFKGTPYKLVIAGDADHATAYSQSLKKQAKEAGVILPGFVKGNTLNQLFANAALFVLPSYYEGLPISLLEAMSYGLPILASNIKANLQVQLLEDDYFTTGDVNALARKLLTFKNNTSALQDRKYDMTRYNWKHIAGETIKVYNELLEKKVSLS